MEIRDRRLIGFVIRGRRGCRKRSFHFLVSIFSLSLSAESLASFLSRIKLSF